MVDNSGGRGGSKPERARAVSYLRALTRVAAMIKVRVSTRVAAMTTVNTDINKCKDTD